MEEIELFVECDTGCFMNCSAWNEEKERCAAEEDEYMTCFLESLTQNQADGCVDCYNQIIAELPEEPCEDRSTSFCQGLRTCDDCQPCMASLTAYADCGARINGCFISCDR
jgi:hypothetical protein